MSSWIQPTAVKQGEGVAVVAGQGDFAVRVTQALRDAGARVLVLGVERDHCQAFEPFAESIVPVRLSEGAKALESVQSRKIRKVTFVGRIVKRNLYDPAFNPDAVTGQILKTSGKEKGDHRILKALSVYLRVRGIRVLGAHELLPAWTAPGKVLSRRTPDEAMLQDIRIGLEKARAVGRLDIGQAVVVKGGTVLAVEGIEGTDAMLDRVGQLGIRGAILAKAAKPQQDLRFDMPVIGEETLERAARAGLAAVAVEKGKTLLVDPGKMTACADRLGLVLAGI